MKLPPIFYVAVRNKARIGREDAALRPSLAQLPFIVYLRSDTHHAAVAFWRAMGRHGYCNRSARRRVDNHKRED